MSMKRLSLQKIIKFKKLIEHKSYKEIKIQKINQSYLSTQISQQCTSNYKINSHKLHVIQIHSKIIDIKDFLSAFRVKKFVTMEMEIL